MEVIIPEPFIEIRQHNSKKLTVNLAGTEDELVNLIAVAMDARFIRRVINRAAELDAQHDLEIGRRQDIQDLLNEN